MANNRMYLYCPVCPKAQGQMIAKYFPSTGWCPVDDERINDFFNDHYHRSQWGAGFVLKFEIAPDYPAPNQPPFIEQEITALPDSLSSKHR